MKATVCGVVVLAMLVLPAAGPLSTLHRWRLYVGVLMDVLATPQRSYCQAIVSCRQPPVRPVAAKKPRFSWDKVPLFQFLGIVNGTLDDPLYGRDPEWLASFPIIFLEHAHGQGYMYKKPPPGTYYGPKAYDPSEYNKESGYFEDLAGAFASKVKSVDPTTTVMYYQQITGALPWYRSAQAAVADPGMLMNPDESPCANTTSHRSGDSEIPNYKTSVWNHSASGVTTNLITSFQDAVASHPDIDGTQYDTAGCYAYDDVQRAGSLETVQAVMDAAPSGKLVGMVSFGGSQALNISALMEYVCGNPGHGSTAAEWMAANYAKGILSLCHVEVEQGDIKYGLASYLAGANELSYFAFSNGAVGGSPWADCDPGSTTWPTAPGSWCKGQAYMAEYDRPLGAPLGPAVPTGGANGEVRREFGTGTNVTVALTGSTCVIDWSDGTQTVCDANQ